MTMIGAHCMRDDPQILSRRLAAFVRPRATAKELSQLIDCDVRTAENIREGHWPIARHWFGLLKAFGEDVTEAVFHPEKAAARLELEVRTLEAKLARTKAELAAVQGDSPRVAEVDRPNPRRPAKDLDEELFVPRVEPAARTDLRVPPGMRGRT